MLELAGQIGVGRRNPYARGGIAHGGRCVLAMGSLGIVPVSHLDGTAMSVSPSPTSFVEAYDTLTKRLADPLTRGDAVRHAGSDTIA